MLAFREGLRLPWICSTAARPPTPRTTREERRRTRRSPRPRGARRGADRSRRARRRQGRRGRNAAALGDPRGHEALAEAPTARGAPADAKDDEGGTPLHWAISGGHTETSRAPIWRGAEGNGDERRCAGRSLVDTRRRAGRRSGWLHWPSVQTHFVHFHTNVAALDRNIPPSRRPAVPPSLCAQLCSILRCVVALFIIRIVRASEQSHHGESP
jgi:hypothetical protein